jgi:1,4-dihydroxy-2-naphthoyl-CoA hydrolase
MSVTPLSEAKQTLMSTIGIEVTEQSAERVVARMPVGPAVMQPFGLLHGGASVALAETIASIAAWMNVDHDKFNVVGLEINANHLRGVREGVVTGVALPITIGRRIHVWDVRITDDKGRLVCISRCTVAVVPKE